MKKGMMTLLLAFVLVVGLGIFNTQTKADEAKWKVISYTSHFQFIAVPDEEGHVVAAFDRRGAAIFEDGELAAWWALGTVDWINSNGGGTGYHQYTFKDGSTIWTNAQFTSRIPPGEKLNFIEAKGDFVKGTGRFEGIKGSWTCKGPFITPYTPDKTKGDLVFDCSGTRVLPGK